MKKRQKRAKQFTIILTRNRKSSKKYSIYKTYEGVLNKFNKILEQSNKVLIPKRKISDNNGVREIFYELLLLSDNVDNEPQVFYNEYGIPEQIEIESGKWKVLKKVPFYVEETYKVYNHKKRLTVHEIYKSFFPECNTFINVVCFLNKLVIDRFDVDEINKLPALTVILCKDIMEVQRLHDKLKELAVYHNQLNYLFFGQSTINVRNELRDDLIAHIGLKKQEAYRTKSK